MTTELYVSECCGVVVAPGSTAHDDIHDAEQGTRLMIEDLDDGLLTEPGKQGRVCRVYTITRTDADLYDAMRAGECPVCGADTPALTELEGSA